jgi:DNA-binding MarR family transcriptional regulator
MMEPYQRFARGMGQFVKKFTIRDRNEKFCYGVTLTQCYTLESIANQKKMTMLQLSNELGLAISTITRVVDILVRDGFIQRYHGKQDRRNVYVELMDKGREMAEKLKVCSEQSWLGVFNQIPHSKRSRIIEDVELLYMILEEVNRKCCTSA